MLYKVCNGAITLDGNVILEEINFEVKNQEHVAIVGRNGSGKTTLLRAIIGDVSFEQGVSQEEFVITRLGNFNIGYVKQDAIQDGELTLLDEILKAYEDILTTEKKLRNMEYQLEYDYNDKLLNQYQDLQLHFQIIGGYTYQKEYELALLKFGFQDNDKYKKLKEFSYGQRTKIAFLKLILSKPDLLLLDEPTNHLDVLAIEWLEKYLVNYPKMLVIVSHDRMFLDSVCNVTYEIEFGRLKRYSGNYSFYEKQKKLDYENALKKYDRQQKEIERLKMIADKFRYKPAKASMAISKLKQIERMVKIEKPEYSSDLSFPRSFNPLVESYREVLKVKELKFGYDKVLGEVDFILERGEKLAIIGENGTGKSTFLKTIMGEIPKLSGKYVFGNRVEIGYFDQNVESLNGDDTVIDVMRNEFPLMELVELRNVLGSFEFTGDMVFQKVSSLSGGQKVKLLLCKLMKRQVNLLILDEPTNHLDIISRQTIAQLLSQYKGTVIFISHDRYFVNQIATSVLAFENGKVLHYKGDYNYYLEHREKESFPIEEKVIRDITVKKKYVSDFKERSKLEKKVSKIENEIAGLEDKIKDCYENLSKEEVYNNLEKTRKFEKESRELESLLSDKMIEWEELLLIIDS